MKSILQRLVTLIKIWLNAFLAAAEDPRRTFAAAFQRHHELLDRVRHARENIAASKAQVSDKTEQVRSRLPLLQERARQALIAGREDVARLSLQLRQVAAEDLQCLERQVYELDQEEQTLSLIEYRLTTQIEAYLTRKEVLEARYATAEAQVSVHEALVGVSDDLSGLGLALERSEERAEQMWAQASALDQLIQAGVLEPSGSQWLGADGVDTNRVHRPEAVEERLEAMKAQLGGE